MEAIGIGLEAIGHALSATVGWVGMICIISIAALTFLIDRKVVSFDEVKEFFKKDRKYK